MIFSLPDEVSFIIHTLEEADWEAWVVGGCVRDVLRRKTPKDWDICTNAYPETVLEQFQQQGLTVVPTGLKHGTVTVVMQGEHYEITTFRTEGNYTDHRRPDHVIYTSSLKQDLARRDFTVNAMAYHPQLGITDPFGGRIDLDSGIIRAVGMPDQRFREDALRMMRAVRFACQLNYSIEPNTFAAIREHSALITHISNERIRDELCKIITSSIPDIGFRLLYETGLLSIILPEWHYQDDEQYGSRQVTEPLSRIPARMNPRLAAIWLLAKLTPGTVETTMRRLKFDRQTISDVIRIGIAMTSLNEVHSNLQVKRLINQTGLENLADLFELAAAWKTTESTACLIRAEAMRMIQEGHPMTLKELAVNGKDLLTIGMQPGNELGRILGILLEKVMEHPELNSRDQLLEIAKSLSAEQY